MSQDQGTGLLLLGVGGGGCRLAASVRAAYGEGMQVVCVDTDAQPLRTAAGAGMTTVLLGGSRLSGHGTGGDAILGRLAAQDDLEALRAQIHNVRTVVILACLGGGTGGGATPEIVKALHDMGLATVCFVTRPFVFEGEARAKSADRVLPMIEEHADTLIVIPQDDLFSDAHKDLLGDAIQVSESLISAGVTLLWRLVTKPGFIQLDPERLHKMVLQGGSARFGFASASGADRARQAVEALKSCRLLRKGDSLSKANALMFGILAGADLRLAEIGEAMGALRSFVPQSCLIEMGTVLDAQYEGRIELVALSFESWVAAVARSAPKAKETVPPAAAEPPVADIFPIQPGSRRSRAKGSKLSFGATGRGKFRDVEPTLYEGQDLDVPTYIRRGITLER
ncbi:MAG TPA: hypothetical protein P5026_05945 [Kiritimatiellia bacterium]|nr:hypothetical protein [Kiritimatiellia bacterium]HRU70631.1 hypothetical protein [Kiritimatiellia bacterium]